MERAIDETNRRRSIQQKYNELHGIIPKSVSKKVADILEISTHDEIDKKSSRAKRMTKAQKQQLIEQLRREMKAAAKILEFEHAAYLRDKIRSLEEEK